jgi:hypothetical protein
LVYNNIIITISEIGYHFSPAFFSLPSDLYGVATGRGRNRQVSPVSLNPSGEFAASMRIIANRVIGEHNP